MKNKYLFAITYLFLFSFGMPLLAQDSTEHKRCSSQEVHQYLMSTDSVYRKNRQEIEEAILHFSQSAQARLSGQGVITIPVVFHIIRSPTGAYDVSDALIQTQIKQLNDDFRRTNTDRVNTGAGFKDRSADCEIQFRLATRDPNGLPTTGITRLNDTLKAGTTTDISGRIMPVTIWDRNRYLNIWTAKLQGGLLGYAPFPGGSAASDGIVVSYSTIGSLLNTPALLPYNKGRTATHEIGHWLGIFHIWGDDGGSCSGSDLVADTPNQGAENNVTPTYPLLDGCSPTAPGVMFMNYMDYVNDQTMNAFTNGQKTRMMAALNSTRSSLLTSDGCLPFTPDFALNANIGTQDAAQGNSLLYTINTTALNGYSGTVNLSTQDLPANCTATFSTNSVTAGSSSTLTLSVGGGVAPGFYNLNVNASGKLLPLTFRVTSVVISVELSQFEAKIQDKAVELAWTTESEINNLGFEIQKSDDYGVKNAPFFAKIGFVHGSDNQQIQNNYQFYDTDVKAGTTYYYRLKQMDKDGKITYSKIVSASFGSNEDILLSPNPAKSFLDLTFLGKSKNDAKIEIISINGQRMAYQVWERDKPLLRLDLSSLPSGLYFLKCQIGERFIVKKVVLE